MQKMLLLATGMMSAALSFAQDSLYVSSTMDLNLYTRNYAHTDSLLRQTIAESGARIMELEDNREMSSTDWLILANRSQFEKLAQSLPSLGVVARNEIQTSDLTLEIRTARRTIASEKENLKDSTINDSLLRIAKLQLQSHEWALEDLLEQIQAHKIKVRLMEDNPYQYSYDTDSWFSFINMPGAEYKYLVVEQPKQGRTAEYYQGASLRYMFTQGKSYIHIGAMRPVGEVVGDSMITDVFYYDWGTDFYARHLGKGKRTFLNPFSGFSLGGLILSTKEDTYHVPTVEAHVGIELLKLQYLIFDIRGGYFFPFGNEWNRHLRGATAATAFNFVF